MPSSCVSQRAFVGNVFAPRSTVQATAEESLRPTMHSARDRRGCLRPTPYSADNRREGLRLAAYSPGNRRECFCPTEHGVCNRRECHRSVKHSAEERQECPNIARWEGGGNVASHTEAFCIDMFTLKIAVCLGCAVGMSVLS